MSTAAAAIVVLFTVALSSAALLLRDMATASLRERVQHVRSDSAGQTPSPIPRVIPMRSATQRNAWVERLVRLLRLFPDIPQQNIIDWRLVFLIAGAVAVIGFFYLRNALGWPIALLLFPIECLAVARCIFGWERLRFQKTLLEQIPDVMATICRAVGAGIPLSEALRSVAREAPSPSRDEFVRVVNDVTIGQPLEAALWKLHERADLPEYAFFAVTIGLHSQTGGNLMETLQNLQELVRRRVALSKRGKALAAEARVSAIILGSLPVAMCGVLYFIRPGFFAFFANTPSGTRLLQIACGLMMTGIIVMRQMIRRSLAP